MGKKDNAGWDSYVPPKLDIERIRPIDFQSCRFQRKCGGKWEYGIARMKLGHDDGEVSWIVDLDGKIVDELWNFVLLRGFGAYIRIP